MGLISRIRRLEGLAPRCAPGVHRLAGPDEPGVDDPCPRCGGSHVLVIVEEIVESRLDRTGPDAPVVAAGSGP
jgi:hypothetical protein